MDALGKTISHTHAPHRLLVAEAGKYSDEVVVQGPVELTF